MSAVIYVEPEDDVRSILARLERVTGSTVGIVVPAARASIVGPVSLRLFRRQAEALGLELGLVTQGPSLQAQATAVGIPVYRSPAAYERAVRRRAASSDQRLAPETASAGLSWATVAALAVLVLLAVAAALVLVPEMSVVVTPRTKVVSESIRVVADPAQASVDLDRQRVPARRVHVVSDAVDQASPGEGEPAGDGKARGIVTFTNRTQDKLVISAGTFISTAIGSRFATEQGTTVPAGIGQVAKVAVVAEVAGEQGNVPRLRINVVLGTLDAKVFVQNEDPTAGGGIPGSRIVTAVDRDRLLKRVSDKARAAAETEMKRSLGPGEILLTPSVQFSPLDTSFDGEVGQETQTLGVRYRAELTGLVVSAEDLEHLGQETWDPLPPPGFEVVGGSVQAADPAVVGVEGQAMVLDLPLKATCRALVDLGQMEQLTRWRSASDASLVLTRAFDLSRPPEIRFTPGWAQRAYRVQVAVASVATATSR